MTVEIGLFNAPENRSAERSGSRVATLMALLMIASPIASLANQPSQSAADMASRPKSKSYLLMPDRPGGAFPPLLSQTGAFSDVRSLAPAPGLIAYDIIVPFWSDGASKLRWIAVPNDAPYPNGKIEFQRQGEWKFPNGTVFVKHFELPVDDTNPQFKRRLETRLLVRDAAGGVYGVTYKWRPDNSDADLLQTNLSETIEIKTATGTRTQTWYYPSRQDCLVCHTANAGLVLGVKTRQLNRPYNPGAGGSETQLRAWNRLGLFDPALSGAVLDSCPKLAAGDDATRGLEDRARSYLDANCAHCHRPGGTVAYFDARYDTPLAGQNLIKGQVLIDQGIDGARAIAPHDIWRSIIFMRANSIDAIKMPPLAHNALDENGISLLRHWIQSLPGRDVLEPPTMTPAQGNYAKPVDVTLNESQPGAAIRYTLDGTVPTTSDPLYEKPLHLAGPTILRAKAFKPGFTRSITMQSVYIIGE